MMMIRKTRSVALSLLVPALLGAAASAALVACGPPPEPPPPPAPTATAAVMATPTPEPTLTATAEVAVVPVCKEPAGPRPKVANLSGDPPVQDWTAWQGDKSAPVEKACQKVLARRTKLLGNVPDPALVEDVSRCLPSAKGAWVLDGSDVRPLKKDKEHAEKGWAVSFVLAYIGPDGTLTRSKTVTGAASARGQEHHDSRVMGLFDDDGDGVSEIVVEDTTDYGEESSQSRKVYTWKNGDIVVVSPAAFVFGAMVDVDGEKAAISRSGRSLRGRGPLWTGRADVPRAAARRALARRRDVLEDGRRRAGGGPVAVWASRGGPSPAHEGQQRRGADGYRGDGAEGDLRADSTARRPRTWWRGSARTTPFRTTRTTRA